MNFSTSSSSSSAAASGDAEASTSGGAADPAAAPSRWQDFFVPRRAASANAPRPEAWRERLPRKGTGYGRHGVRLRARDAARFERMRLVLGYYDLPENAGLPKPPPPSTATISNLQALFFTDDVDSYYKLALLSYRAKQANRELVAPALEATNALLDRLEAAGDGGGDDDADAVGGGEGGSGSSSGSSSAGQP